MTKAPAFQWYPRDILSSSRVQMMTLEEEGAYRRLLDYCWLNGCVPSDPQLAARLIGKGATVLIAKAVLPMFQANPETPGTLIHDRLEVERVRQDANRLKKQRAANERWDTAPPLEAIEELDANAEQVECEGNADANADAVRVECPSAASSSSVATASSVSPAEGAAAPAKPSRKRPAKPKPKSVSDEFVESLRASPAYVSLDVGACVERAQIWCAANEREFNRRFLVNWLNRQIEYQQQGRGSAPAARGNGKSNTQVGASSPPSQGCGKPARFTFTWPDSEPSVCCEECLAVVIQTGTALGYTIPTSALEGEALCP